MTVASNKEKVFGKNRFVFAIINHPALGYMIDAFVVKENEKGVFSYFFQKITPGTYHDYFTDLPDSDKKGLEITNEYSDDNLVKRFNRSKIKAKEFFQKTQKQFIDEHIRPFIDKKVYKLLKLLAENNTPVFYKGDINNRVKEEKIKIHKSFVDVLFKFDKKQEHTEYSLDLFHEGKSLNITDSGAEIISCNPCTLLKGRNLYFFKQNWDGKKLKPFLNKQSVIVPRSSEKVYYSKFVLNAIKNYQVEAKGFSIIRKQGEFSPLLKIENDIYGNIVAGLYFDYKNNVLYPHNDTSDKHTTFENQNGSYSFRTIVRSREKEHYYAALLEEAGLKHKSAMHFSPENPDSNSVGSHNHNVIIDWLTANKELLDREGFVVNQDFSSKKYFTFKPMLNIDVAEKNDWFDININVSFGKYSVPFIKLKDNILKGEREYKLPDGNYVLLPVEWFARFKDLLRFGKGKDNKLALNRHHYTLINNLDNGKNFSGLFSSLKPVNEVHVPQEITAELRSYQVDGYKWLNFLQKNKFGGVLADDMGLGKTLQAITMLTKIYCPDGDVEKMKLPEKESEIKASANVEKGTQLDIFSTSEKNINTGVSLVIMPLSLIHNWIREIEKFSPGLKVYQHAGSKRQSNASIFRSYDIVLTTYGTVRNDIDFLKNYQFNYVILDESQIIKNVSSKIFKAVKELKAKHRLVLTGTPIENSLTDLWAQFSFLNPGMLGSYNFFKDEYVNPIEKNNDVIKQQKLQKIISPFILRRTKDEVEKDLPALTEMTHYCEMTEEQYGFYEEKKSEVRNFLLEKISESGIDRNRFHILSGLMNLRLIANHPKMTDPSYSYTSGKYIEVIRSIEKLLSENHKVLVFSQFVKHLSIFKEYLDNQKVAYSFLTGNTPEKEREFIINDFQNNNESKLFLISLKAGGVGLNLTGADYVFLLDPWWNPAVESQAINRAHRIGQTKKVFVYKFITRNSIEEKITHLQHRKTKLAGMIIDSNNPLKLMDAEQLKSLL